VKFCFKTDNSGTIISNNELKELADIQARLHTGITEGDVCKILTWVDSRVLYNLELFYAERSAFASGKKFDLNEASCLLDSGQPLEQVSNSALSRRCGEAAEWADALLKGLGIDSRQLSIRSILGNDIGDINHYVAVAKFKVLSDSSVIEKEFILDRTFRQFCLDNLTDDEGHRLRRTPEGEKLGSEIMENGFFELTDENGKLYFDAFNLSDNTILSETYRDRIKTDNPNQKYGWTPVKDSKTPAELYRARSSNYEGKQKAEAVYLERS